MNTVLDTIIGDFDDEIAPPAHFIKPRVVERTGVALHLKIFDELVCVDNASRPGAPSRGDPMVIGRIIDGRKGMQPLRRHQVLSFLVAWFVETASI